MRAGRGLEMPPKRVSARKVIPALAAECYCEWVRLHWHGLAVSLKVLPRLQLGSRAKFTSYLRNDQLVLGSREQCPVLRLEFRDLEVPLLLLPPPVAAAAAWYPLPHSPRPSRPKLAIVPQLLPPTSAGRLVPAGVVGIFPAGSGSRASPLRAPPPWVYR